MLLPIEVIQLKKKREIRNKSKLKVKKEEKIKENGKKIYLKVETKN